MPTKTKIEWCDYISNPLKARFEAGPYQLTGGNLVTKTGHVCVKVSEGCANCWASTFNVRLGTGLEYTAPNLKKVETFLDEKELDRLMTFRPTGPFKNGRQRALVFPCDMTDLFGHWVLAEQLKQIFMVFDTRQDLDFIILTKRPGTMLAFLAGAAPLKNVILGVSIENNQMAKQRWEAMNELHMRGWKTAVSFEPALSFVDWENMFTWIDWLICGGESGNQARPMIPNLARQARDFCQANEIPYFFKQWGEFAPVKECLAAGMETFKNKPVNMWGELVVKVGKGMAGHLLDGKEWRQVP